MSDWATVLSAFATGIGSLAAAYVSVRISQRRAKKDCDIRVDEVTRSIRTGAEIEREHHEHP